MNRKANLNINEDTDGEDLCNEVYDDNVKSVNKDNGVPINVSNNISHKSNVTDSPSKASPSLITTRSGRIIKPPVKFQDYVKE